MTRLIVRRLLLAVPLIVAMSALMFVLLQFVPGDAASEILGPYATPSELTQLKSQLGLDEPVLTQYWHWISHAVTGDLGSSLINSQPVATVLMQRLPVTIALVVGGTLLSVVLGVGLGILSGRRQSASGAAFDALALLGFAIPGFWLGGMLIDLLALKVHLLPATGYVAFASSPGGWAKALVLPVITLAAPGITGIAKQTRDAISTEMSRDYVDALRAAGIPERRIVWRYALKNAALPIITFSGVFLVGMLNGSVIVENVFAMPGLGSLAVTSTTQGDLPVVLGIATVFCLLVVAVNLLVDLSYGWLNPKVRIK